MRPRSLLVIGVAQVLAWTAPLGAAGASPATATSPGASLEPPPAAPASLAARPPWARRIDRLVPGGSVGVSVREGTAFLYRHADVRRRIPASNQKLLMSMAIFERLGPDARLVTEAAAGGVDPSGVVQGNLWILGHGDPRVGAARLGALAREVADAGVVRVEGSIVGSTGYFKRDWRAPGWRRSFPREEVALPTALTFERNEARGRHIRDPELRAAREMTRRLRKAGVRVADDPRDGPPPDGLQVLASVQSRTLRSLLSYTNRFSSNFHAEVLGKRLGVEVAGVPGSIAKGASAIEAYAGARGVSVVAHDSSGLSYRNRVAPSGLVRLLGDAEAQPWGEALRSSLAGPGQGTLSGRLRHVPVRAKSGTLSGVSALSGWVRLRSRDAWAEFSIISRGLSKDRAMRIEDGIVRILWRSAG